MTASSLLGDSPQCRVRSSRRLIAVLLLLCGAAVSALDCTPGSTCFSSQAAALQEFYTALGGPTWRLNTNWLSTRVPGQHCAWTGVYCCAGCSALGSSGAFLQTTCSTPCSVIGLNLPNNNLIGELAGIDATVWQQLTTVEFIDIQGNTASSCRSWSTLVPVSLAGISWTGLL